MNLFTHILVCPALDILDLSTRCGWVKIDFDGMLKLSDRGLQLHETSDYQIRLRLQIQDIISVDQPSWSSLFPKGRQETARFVDPDVRQCLDEAGLLSSNLCDDVVAWWDQMAALVRGVKSSVLSNIGRTGERLSIAYERKRTGRHPTWQSIESNLSGFDILSCLSDIDASPLQIEVKASGNSWRYAYFYLTANEWESATLAHNYHFHLWALDANPKLAVVSLAQMERHIPLNSGEGEWKTVRVPFSVFSDRFMSVNLESDIPRVNDPNLDQAN
jgi:hypothetical protein